MNNKKLFRILFLIFLVINTFYCINIMREPILQLVFPEEYPIVQIDDINNLQSNDFKFFNKCLLEAKGKDPYIILDCVPKKVNFIKLNITGKTNLGVLTIYIDTGKGFNEEEKIIKSINYNRKPIEIRICREKIERLRIDYDVRQWSQVTLDPPYLCIENIILNYYPYHNILSFAIIYLISTFLVFGMFYKLVSTNNYKVIWIKFLIILILEFVFNNFYINFTIGLF